MDILQVEIRTESPPSYTAFNGRARFERLLARSGAAPVARLIRFDDGFSVAEDAAGKVVANLGSAPYLMDPAILGIPADGIEIDAGSKFPDSVGPRITVRQPASYAEFVLQWKTNIVFQRIREARAATAADAWETVGSGPKTVSVALRQSVVLNPAGPAAVRAESSDPSEIQVSVDAANGRVTATAVADGDAIVTLWMADGNRSRCIVETPNPIPGANRSVGLHQPWIPGKQAGWDAVGEHLVSDWKRQPHYFQIENDPEMCKTTVCGCGPTAWAMFFANWDLAGVTKALGDSTKIDAPIDISYPIAPSVLAVTRWTWKNVDEICIPGMDRAATVPTEMHRGLEWCDSRGIGRAGTIKFGLPHASPKCQNLAIDALNAGRISIVGIGFYNHYPIAIGYRRWDWKTKKGKRFRTTYDLLLNLGWGPKIKPEWRTIEQIWYATNLQLN